MDTSLLRGQPFLFQTALFAVLLLAGVLAKRKLLTPHCLLMRLAVVLQVVFVVRWMFPSLVSHLGAGMTVDWFFYEMVGHALVGLALISLWVYINLVYLKVIKVNHRLVWEMRAAFGLYLVSYAVGVHMYVFAQRL